VALSIVAYCVLLVFCLAPLTMYFAWLGVLNRRQRPTIIGGTWDLAALVAGLSGFILFGGGLLVAGLHSNARIVARGNWEQVRAAWGQERVAWGVVAAGYLVIVGGGIALTAIARSRTLSVYNVEREQVVAAVEGALAEIGVSAARFGNVWSDQRTLVVMDAFDGLCHVNLRLAFPDNRIREELERSLRLRLQVLSPAENPAAGWLALLSTGSITVMLLCVGLVAYFLYLVS
jgi:hypothetical protein